MQREDNALITEVDSGKPMNEALKRYWLPAALSNALYKDCDPVRLTLLCEDYVMFRDSEGRVGILREQCCHRGASLVLGRNEEGGLRCLFHGWKFAVDGRILEMPNATDNRYLARYRQPSYPVREAGGFIWVYLGPKEKEPPFPRYGFFDVPETHRVIELPVGNANYVQLIEALVDTSHVGALHSDAFRHANDAEMVKKGNSGALFRQLATGLAPIIDLEDAEFGFHCAGIRQEQHEGKLVYIARVAAFAMPFMGFIPGGNIVVMGVPITNTRTHFYHVFWDYDQPFTEERTNQLRAFFGLHEKAMNDWGLSARTKDLPTSASRANNFLQDRAAMRRGETFSGILTFVPEDVAICESMGGVLDRTTECLIPADVGVNRMRRLLMESARRVQNGEDPIGVNPSVRPVAVQGIIPDPSQWRTLLPRQANAA